MTFEELLEMPVDDINKLTDAQLVQYLTPFFPLTRPRDIMPAFASAGGDLPDHIQAKLAALKSQPSIKSRLCAQSSSTPPASSGPPASDDTASALSTAM